MSVNQEFIDRMRRAVQHAKDHGTQPGAVRVNAQQLKLIEGEFAINPPGSWGPQILGIPIEIDESVSFDEFQLV